MSGTVIRLPELHEGQRVVRDSHARFRVLACGRRWGKTRFGVAVSLYAAAQKFSRIWWVAPTYPMATVGWRLLRAMGAQLPGVQIREADRQVLLPMGGSISVRSASDPDSLRGDGLDFVVMDEAAYMEERAWTEAIRPALADKLGGALFLSTPAGRNWFWRLYMAAEADETGEWAVFHQTTYDAPHVPKAEIDAAKASLPDRVFRQEFMAEFLEDGSGVFQKVIQAAVVPAGGIEPKFGGRYVIGVDWARKNDYTVFVVVDTDTGEVVHVTRFSGVDYRSQLNRLRGVVEKYRPTAILAEENSMGGPLVEELQMSGMRIRAETTGWKNKGKWVSALQLAFEKEQIRIPNDPVLINELQAFESKQLESGVWKYSAPEGMHDDFVMALCLAWWAGRQYAPSKVIRRAFPGMVMQ